MFMGREKELKELTKIMKGWRTPSLCHIPISLRLPQSRTELPSEDPLLPRSFVPA